MRLITPYWYRLKDLGTGISVNRSTFSVIVDQEFLRPLLPFVNKDLVEEGLRDMIKRYDMSSPEDFHVVWHPRIEGLPWGFSSNQARWGLNIAEDKIGLEDPRTQWEYHAYNCAHNEIRTFLINSFISWAQNMEGLYWSRQRN
jgi:hypothetical protein